MDQTKLLESEKKKDLGNQEYLKKNYEKAVDHYSEAIQILGETIQQAAIYFCNRSMCYIHMDRFAAGLEDAEKAILADKNFIKGYYRKS